MLELGAWSIWESSRMDQAPSPAEWICRHYLVLLMHRPDACRTKTQYEWSRIMLVLSRNVNERIKIGDQIWITVVRLGLGAVQLGVDAPPDIIVLREELVANNDGQPETLPKAA
jgi:carbon storage regulator